jgi:hypothetical protein
MVHASGCRSCTCLLHISLFPFFAGLGDSLNVNTAVGLSTVVPIGIGGLLCIFTISVPIISTIPLPKLILRYSLVSVPKVGWTDRGSDGRLNPVGANMTQGQMQLAMEETEKRKGRDEWAIRWLVDNITDDAEMGRFMMAIPRSFSTVTGSSAEVWENVGNTIEDESEDKSRNEPVVGPPVPTTQAMPLSSDDPYALRVSVASLNQSRRHSPGQETPHHPPANITTLPPVPRSPHVSRSTTRTQGKDVVQELSENVACSLETCENRNLFANDDLWRRHTRACIETTASLVYCANTKYTWFGHVSHLRLIDGIWTTTCCGVTRVESFAGGDATSDEQALIGAQKIDKIFQNARDCLHILHEALSETENRTKDKGYFPRLRISDPRAGEHRYRS